MDKVHQVYVDPIFIKGNIFRTYIWWNWKTRLEVSVEFINKKNLINIDRFKQIGFILELMRRSGIDVMMTKEQFINIHFKEFPGLKIDITKIDF